MGTLLSANDLSALRNRFGRRVLIGLAVAVLFTGTVTIIWLRADSTPKSSENVALLNTKVSVVNDTGSQLLNRLTVLFVDGREAGRTDSSGQLRGLVPQQVRSIPAAIITREGEAQVESFPPEPQAIAYTFPGDSLNLPFDITGCRLSLDKTGVIRCTETRPPVPLFGTWIMLILVAILVLFVAVPTARQVVPWPHDWRNHEWGKTAREAGAWSVGTLMMLIVTTIFWTSGVFDAWMVQLADTFSGAVNIFLGAIGVVVGGFMVYVWIRNHLTLPKW